MNAGDAFVGPAAEDPGEEPSTDKHNKRA
jgi:hypothetical protein